MHKLRREDQENHCCRALNTLLSEMSAKTNDAEDMIASLLDKNGQKMVTVSRCNL